MEFLFFLLLLFIGYIIIRYRETTFPLIKKVFGDIQSDIEKVRTATAKKAEGTMEMPYEQKEYFFSIAELEFFRILNSHLDAHRHTVFPKVRLGDFVKVVDGTARRQGAWNRIKSKHIDYLVWDLVENKLVLAIELDGNSHNGHSAEKNDHFKNDMYEKVGLRLIRVKVGESFEEAIQKIVAELPR
jgi:hypothetical protein